MTFQLDTSGEVATDYNPLTKYRWSELSPFAQGYIEALFVSLREDDLGYLPVSAIKDVLRFDKLAPETLAQIIADCEIGQTFMPQVIQGDPKTGATFWNDRQASLWEGAAFPRLNVCLNDSDKVVFS